MTALWGPKEGRISGENGALDKAFRLPIHSGLRTRLDANSAATGFATWRSPRKRDVAQHEFRICCVGDNKMHHEHIRRRSTRGVVPSYI